MCKYCYIQVCSRKKNKTDEEISLFCVLKEQNKQADKISGQLPGGCLFGDKRLLWSGRLVLSSDAHGMASDLTGRWPLFGLFMCSWFQTPAPENATCGKNMIGWKIDCFFIIENFLGILDRLCAEPICRSHDFLCLTLTVVGSTSGSCYFLLQCWCLWVCVLCVLVVRCVKG